MVPKMLIIFHKEVLICFEERTGISTFIKMKRMGHTKTVILITLGLILFSGAFFYYSAKQSKSYFSGVSSEVTVERTWDLPKELKEVSGIAFLEPNRVACVQDEDGIIFIYNLETSQIDQSIEFGGSGDYEGIAIQDHTAFVLRSDGTIFKINNFLTAPTTEVFDTDFFSSKNDMESFFFDTVENRLLITSKSKDPVSKDYTGIYAVSPTSLQIEKEPVYKMTFKNDIFEDIRKKKAAQTFFPSEMNRDPNTGNLMILEARKPQLLILDSKGQPQELHRLDPEIFPQPEGLTFDASGNLYISNEGNPATIHLVKINKK